MTPRVEDDVVLATYEAYVANGNNQSATAVALGVSRETVQRHVRWAAERGLISTAPVMPGFAIKSVASKTADGAWIKQGPEDGEEYQTPDGLVVQRRSVLAGPDNRVKLTWYKEDPDAQAQLAAMRAAVEGFKDDLPRTERTDYPAVHTLSDLLAFYAVTDLHLGALAWREETGSDDYDTAIAERLVEDWFAAAIHLAPNAQTAILAQIGDLLHWDGFESVTPTSRHVLDGDTRFPKMVRAAIRVLRKIVRRLLEKHDFVHIIMADANHDPASEVWLREMFAAFYEDEPRVTVDQSAGTYYAYRHGDVSLFVHHGHRRKISNVDSVFAGRFREMYGATKYSYAHLGHLHSDELKSTNLMKVERHETLAAPDAYAANGGWLSGRSAKVIVYHREHGEVSRLTLTPQMVAGAAKYEAVNDNEPRRAVA